MHAGNGAKGVRAYLVLFGATDKDRDETLTLILFPFYLCVSIPLSYFICEEEMCF